jgi:hypothetical protein
MKILSNHTVLKAQLPEPYYLLIRKYFRAPKLCSNLSEAIRLTIPWHPNATAEGYYFWEQVYNWSKGLREKPPRINTSESLDDYGHRDIRYYKCKVIASKALNVISDELGCIVADKETENVYKRYILFNYLIGHRNESFGLKIIGRVVADLIGRKSKFDHATVLHARRVHFNLLDTKDPVYCKMVETFNQRMESIDLEIEKPLYNDVQTKN